MSNFFLKNRLLWPIPVQYFLLLFFKFLTSLISGDIFNFPVWRTNGTTLLNNFDGPNCYAQLSLLEYCFFDPWLCSVFLSNLNLQAYRRSRILQFLTKSHPNILNYYSLKSYTTGKPKILPLEPLVSLIKFKARSPFIPQIKNLVSLRHSIFLAWFQLQAFRWYEKKMQFSFRIIFSKNNYKTTTRFISSSLYLVTEEAVLKFTSKSLSNFVQCMAC